ncbi:hypothetical protein GX48_06011 [Paracoccidioides brasiliensis]|nr:hypothetical protein GX48_06011 [Paracoccidioides brasiliensis]
MGVFVCTIGHCETCHGKKPGSRGWPGKTGLMLHRVLSKVALPISKNFGMDPSSHVGIEYIIQDLQLHEQWSLMDTLQLMQCTKD